MKTGTIARIGAAGFVVTALALSAVQLDQTAPPQAETIVVPANDIDPLRAELRRCRSIGQAAASDTLCMRAWAQQRSRFFMQAQKEEGANFNEVRPTADENSDRGAAVGSNPAAPSTPVTGQGSN